MKFRSLLRPMRQNGNPPPIKIYNFFDQTWAKWLFRVALFTAAFALIRTTAHVGNDFDVFWETAKNVIEGKPAYAETPLEIDRGMVFKYPPWLLPVFFPFAVFPVAIAKWMWGVFSIFCLALVVKETRKTIQSPVVLYATLLSFWGIWQVNALDGQINLMILAIAWGSLFKPSAKERTPRVFWALSTKVFTLLALVGMGFKWNKKTFTILVITVFILSVPCLLTTRGQNPTRLVTSWVRAATSGGAQLKNEKTRGRDNQGIPAAVMRMFGVPASNTGVELGVSVLLILFFGGAWKKLSVGLDADEQWASWLALSAAVHPLAWFHLFALSFPLAVLALDSSWREFHLTGKKIRFGLALAGVLCIAVITRKTLGVFGAVIEQFSIKSLGVLLCICSVWLRVNQSKAVESGHQTM
jgi:hypothetical protein